MTEGVLVSQGLLYTTLINGDDRIMVPNSIVLSSSIVPLREPSGVDVRVRLPAGMRLTELERRLDDSVTVTTRQGIEIGLDEITTSGCSSGSPPRPSTRTTGPRWRTRCSPLSPRWRSPRPSESGT